ncbi:MAG: hypothetical protein QXU79_01540 [Candidatus Micrarchaeaceae archaeon]
MYIKRLYLMNKTLVLAIPREYCVKWGLGITRYVIVEDGEEGIIIKPFKYNQTERKEVDRNGKVDKDR